MESVKRYRFKGAAGDYVYAADFDRVTAECDGLQLSLTTADQAIDDLQTAIARRNQRIDELTDLLTHAHIAIHTMTPGFFLLERIDAALKPTAEAESQ
jgi:hypothetical protein